VNANQVFKWRRLVEKGQLGDAGARSTALLPITLCADPKPTVKAADAHTETVAASSGAIHIELPGRAMISVESGADPTLLRCALESLRK
jgi:transposase-like protein